MQIGCTTLYYFCGMEKKITKEDLINVCNTMSFYNASSGYMDFVGGKICYFDSDPRLDDVGACPVEISELKKWIEEY